MPCCHKGNVDMHTCCRHATAACWMQCVGCQLALLTGHSRRQSFYLCLFSSAAGGCDYAPFEFGGKEAVFWDWDRLFAEGAEDFIIRFRALDNVGRNDGSTKVILKLAEQGVEMHDFRGSGLLGECILFSLAVKTNNEFVHLRCFGSKFSKRIGIRKLIHNDVRSSRVHGTNN